VEGHHWNQSCVDVCIAGVGWVGIGLKGLARLKVWRWPNIAITSRDAWIPDFAERFESPGWSENSKTLFATRDSSGKGTLQKPKRSTHPPDTDAAPSKDNDGGQVKARKARKPKSSLKSDRLAAKQSLIAQH
jgi:hypothetical protein